MKTPASFFKFVGPDRIDVLQNGCVRFTPPKGLNDPFECNPYITHLTRDWIDGLDEGMEIGGEWGKEDYDFSMSRHCKRDDYLATWSAYASKLGILSLSAHYDTNPNPSIYVEHKNDPRHNLLMWAHYCDSHKGFVIEFDPAFITDGAKEVLYRRDRPVLTFEEIDGGDTSAFLVKSPQWCYENEWRVIRPLDEVPRNERGFHLLPFNKSCVKSITIGNRADQKTIDAIETCVFRGEYRGAQLFRARIRQDTFSLDFEQFISHKGRVLSNATEFGIVQIDIQRAP